MILVISNIINEAAPAMVDSFPAGAASLITATDFYCTFRAGVSVNDFSSSVIITGGKKIPVAAVTGVITTVPSFLPVEFYFIKTEDRDYVCAETNAFFLYFLHELRAVACNPAGWKSFIGWNVHKMEWVSAATKLHIPLAPYRFKNGFPEPTDMLPPQLPLRCTIIYDHITDESLPFRVQQYTRALAFRLGTPWLDCYFTELNGEYQLAQINTIPDISRPEFREAIANRFLTAVTV